MAKRFGGFTPEQLGKIVPEMQGMQADEQAKFLAATPGAAARVGAMTDRARSMIEGKPVGMAEGGLTTATAQGQLDAAQKAQADALQALSDAQAAQAANPEDEALVEAAKKAEVEANRLNDAANKAMSSFKATNVPSAAEMLSNVTNDPSGMITKPDVATMTPAQVAGGKISGGTGQAGSAEEASVTTAQEAAPVETPTLDPTVTVDPSIAQPSVEEGLDKTDAATSGALSKSVNAEQGTVSSKSLASEKNRLDETRISKVNENVNLEVTKQQLAEAKGKKLRAITSNIAQSAGLADAVAQTEQVQPEELPSAAVIEENMMAQARAITSSGLDEDAIPLAAKMSNFSVDNGTLAKAMEGEVNALATVEGQMSQLMKSFDDGTPAWAAGAMRAANAAMASRGLGASSMASAAILQAAMESALPIAQQDAQTFERMGLKNLDNRQQVALSNAAAQQGLALQNLSNEQQANLQRSAQAFQLQTANLSNRQSAELANAQIRASLQGQNLSNQQQTNIAVAARYAEQANINLNNKQQASMQTNANQLQTNLANLSSKSQAYITNANLAASLQGQVLSNDQQVSIANAARYADSSNISFTAQQQNALHNSKMMQTIGLSELDANMAATLQNAATYASMDTTNLNNRQLAQVQNAKSFLELDMANLSNEQQTSLFKSQSLVNTILSDTAAVNAISQFNASSENQANQFFANLATQVSQFNVDQSNFMSRFNAGEENAISQFNANQKNMREQFNATNALVVAQANAQWMQSVATQDNAAQNLANRDAAAAANNMTANAFNAVMQETRDLMSYAFQSADNDATRATNLAIAQIASDDAAAAAAANRKSGLWGALGNLAATGVNAYFKYT